MKQRSTILLAAVLLIAAAVSLAAILRPAPETDRPVARITLDGELLREIDLSRVTQPETFTVTAADGGTNTITVEPGRIRVSAADCPDQICVDQGFISDGTTPIVCLPHKLMISISGGGNDLDGAAG